ncbi:MAG: radical SAM protein [Syntrophus sp. (in: bacteria)]|nr:radical SAM protein [Syntrophus sp. (in: bacteria)]
MNAFDMEVSRVWPGGLYSEHIETFQVNLGRFCNLACRHCHLECSPDRTEMMAWETMLQIIKILRTSAYQLVDVTGGSPELHPHFRPFIDAIRETGQTVQVRTNLVSLLESNLEGTAAFLKDHGVLLVGSLPCYLEENVTQQRGPGVYEKSIEAIRMLNRLGYARDEGLILNLVHNPGGPYLAGNQSDLEKAYRDELKNRFGIYFNNLYVINNMPIGRFRQNLDRSGRTDQYSGTLEDAFDPVNVPGLMCRHQICVDWDGKLYDCDFNLALCLCVNHGSANRIETFRRELLNGRQIATGPHCFVCTAGKGSSCCGALQ